MGLINRFKNLFKNNEERVDYEAGFLKTSENVVGKIEKLAKKHRYGEGTFFEELEEILIGADIGVKTVNQFMNKIISNKKMKIVDLKKELVNGLISFYGEDSNDINFADLTVLLFVGVNGSGKTTSLAKLAWQMKQLDKKVLIVAADTFRAGATEQLRLWGERLDIAVIEGEGDPTSVIYEGLEFAKKENYDVVLIDTAGRLQTKDNLMAELEKMNKVIGRLVEGAPHETLLVIDATTGQNGISQAISFREITNVTGIILTKLDGTAKGGVVLAIKGETGIPVKFIGLGEKKEDLKKFELGKYVYGLFRGWENEV